MDFAFTEEQQAVAEAAAGVFSGLVDIERVTAVECSEDRVDRELWQALADADLLGLAVPEEHGGGGYGLMELCLLLEAQGNVVAPVPLWATLVLGALPIARFGSAAQRERWLPGVVAGRVLLTAALNGCAASPTSSPAVSARTDGEGFVLTDGAGGAAGARGGPGGRAGPGGSTAAAAAAACCSRWSIRTPRA